MRKFYLNKEGLVDEVDFVSVAGILKTQKNAKRIALSESFFERLDENKRAFNSVFEIEVIPLGRPGGNTAEAKLERRLKSMDTSPLVEEDEEYLRQVFELIERGAIPKNTMKRIWEKIKDEDNSNRMGRCSGR